MTDYSELIEELREQARLEDEYPEDAVIKRRAADALEAQARLIEALKDIEDDLTVAYMAGLAQGRDEARAALNGEKGNG
jgi:hypothetical protein